MIAAGWPASGQTVSGVGSHGGGHSCRVCGSQVGGFGGTDRMS
jgi:hypothetical protein